MHDVTTQDCSRIAQDLQIRKVQVESVVQLLDEGNSIPFIARYRKERTGGLSEEILRNIHGRLQRVRQLAERKQTILKSVENQGKLTSELRAALLSAETTKRLEDLYLPFKPKKRSSATVARERGLEPLALAVWQRDAAVANLDEVIPGFVNPDKGLPSPAEVQSGIRDILAEMIAETAEVRAAVRHVLWETGKIVSVKSEKLPEGQGNEFKDFFQFSESLRQIPPHRILALNRGEKEAAIKVQLEWTQEAAVQAAHKAVADFALKGPRVAPPPRVPAEAPAPVSHETTPSDIVTSDSNPSPPATSVPEQTPEISAPTPPATITETTAVIMQVSPASVAQPVPQLPEPCPLPPEVGEPLCAASPFRTPHRDFLLKVIDDALTRLLLPGLEREIRGELSEEAEAHAVAVFARNLRSLLLQPPLKNQRVLAIDPGFRQGCKIAVLDEAGQLLEEAVLFPHGKKPARDRGDKGPSPPAAPPAEAQATLTPSAAPEIVAPSTPEMCAAAPLSPEPLPASTPAATAETAVAPAPDITPVPAAVAAAPPKSINKREEAKTKLEELVTRHRVAVVAIGNGTGCRETEELVSDLIATRLPALSYVIVNEAGASVYAVSAIGREEFPQYDTALRSTISIGRRLQDPLSELVKVDPQNIGVGLYQHDVRRRDLKETLEAVVESCVNHVGVNLNNTDVASLRYIAGLNPMIARDLVEFRKQHGPFQNREQLLQVPSLGHARFVQAAGFVKVSDGNNPLDRYWIHPESYGLVDKILAEIGYGREALVDPVRHEEVVAKLKSLSPVELATKLGAGVPTIADILEALQKPGYDPRAELPPPIFKKGVLKLEDLQPGMELKGTVLNVVDFGAFVDIGLKDSGLVHISQMANRYIKSPYDVVAVNDVVTVWVLTVDMERKRVSLSMIKPGTERKPPQKKGDSEEPQRGEGVRGGRRQGPPRGRQEERRHGRRRTGAPTARSQETAAPPAEAAASSESRPPVPSPRPPLPPRKPRREPPRPKLSKAALEGKVPLRTFGELSALFAAKQHEAKEPVPSEKTAQVQPAEPLPQQAASEPSAAEPGTAAP
jgi:protein Tex